MAAHAPITGAPPCAPAKPVLSRDLLFELEHTTAEFDNLGALLRVAANELGPDGDAEAHRLIHAATFMHKHLEAEFAAVIERAYAELPDRERR